MRKRWAVGIAVALLASFAAANVLAWNHAYALTHFVEDGARTPNPEDLTGLDKAKLLFTGARIPKPPGTDWPREEGLAVSHTSGERETVGTIFFFHGYAANRAQVHPTVAAMDKGGWDLISVDFYGHGDSPGNTTTVGWDEAQDVLEVVEGTQGPVILYGFSMGAAAILRATGPLGLQVDAVIAEGCFGRFDTTVRQRFKNMGLPSWPGTELLLFWGSRQMDFQATAHNPQDYIAQVQAPVLLLHGQDDLRVTLEEAQALGQYGELVVTPGLGHQQLAEVDRAAFQAAVSPFLEPFGY
ncbi:MAG: pimeloyl-ACP methyl ester carboxylesterase [Cognaticolwellia sp.]